MQLGDIVYLYVIDLPSVLAIKQNLNPNRFCKITDIKTVKGGTDKEQYLEYKASSLLGEEEYTFNNYLSPYQYCSIETLENAIEEVKDILLEEKLEDMQYIIKKVKELIK
jgi:hypothetical protein